MEDNSEGGGFDWLSSIKNSMPETHVSYFNLFFNSEKTLYKPGREAEGMSKVPEWFIGPASANIVFSNLPGKEVIAQKKVFENTFLISDSLRKIKWKITSDFRTIAGFDCRKAVGIIMDSVYIIAFYTDNIIVSGGPESFAGLPGMILGIAIPRLHYTLFATKLELTEIKPADLAPPTKGKKVTYSGLIQQLNPVMKDWGKAGKKNVFYVML